MDSVLAVRVAVVAGSILIAPAARGQDSLEQRMQAMEKELADMKSGDILRAAWKDGLFFENAKKDVQIRFGASVQLDGFWGGGDDDTIAGIPKVGTPPVPARIEDSVGFRRARLYASGTVREHVEFKLTFDFADSGGKWKDADVYVGLVKIDPLPNVRVGHFKEPLGLEMYTSAYEHLFIERSLPSAFMPGRNVGVMLSEAFAQDRVGVQLGGFKETSDQGFGAGDGEYAVTARLFGTPWFEEQGRSMLHLGVAARRAEAPASAASFSSKPEANLAPIFVQTGTIASADATLLLAGEALLVLGPFALQGEYVKAAVSTDGLGTKDLDFSGWYAQASWSLTGEPRRYRPAEGTYQAPKPATTFLQGGGLGAWELALRWSSIDLTDHGMGTGDLDDVTVGLNWYLNANTRVAWNVVHAMLDPTAGSSGNADLFEMRVQFAF